MPLLFPLNIENTFGLLLTTLFMTTRSIVIQIATDNRIPKVFTMFRENSYSEGICCGQSRKNLNNNSVR